MIEFPITLTSGGSVCMPGYVFALALGYTKNRGVYRLAVTASGEWEGLTIRCFWHVPDGKDPSSSLVVDGYVAVPASVTAQPGSGCITFEGSDGAKVMTSADLRYRVSANSGTEDGTEPEPGTPAWQQLVDAVHTDATAAEQAKTDAQTAAQQAGASAQKAGNALSDTITAKEDALKATKDAQTAASEASASAENAALAQVTASQLAGQAADSASEAQNSATKAAASQQTAESNAAAAQGSATKAEASASTAVQGQQRAEAAAARAETAQQQTESASTDALDKISSAKTDALKAIGNKQTSATTAVESAQGKALDAVADAKNTSVTAVTDAQTAATQAVGTVQANAIQQMKSTKTDALKAIGDKQTAATQAVDTARDKALQQVGASTEAAQTAANKAATSAGNADQSAQKAAGSLQELKNGIASGDFKGEPGNDGKSPIVTVTDIENGHRVSITDKDGTKTIDVLNGQTGKTGATPVLTIGTVSSGDKPSADITGTPENPVLNLRLQPGPQGPSVALDTTLTHEGEAADAKATGDAISAVKTRQNVLTGSETGNPIAVDDAFPAPLCGLTVYGRSTQDGTPTPDAPMPIVSAGDGGSVAVKVTGKNRMPSNLRYREFVECFVKKNTFITLVFKDGFVSKGGNILFIGENNENLWFGIDANKAEHHITLKANATKFQYLLNDTASENMCLTWNASSPDYEPYREQLLTLPTPNGLPGIPVTSGGTYTDQSGQQWVCDEVDLERGMKVKRVNAVDLSTCTVTGTTELAVTKRLSILLPIRGRDYKTEALCNKLQFLVSFSNDTPHFYVDTSNAQVFIPIGAKNPEEGEYILLYVLATPIETPLTPAELTAYKAISTYGPDTVVQAGDGAGIKLDYQRDVNLVVKNLEDAVASMT